MFLLKSAISNQYKIKDLGDLNFIVGFEINRDRSLEKLSLSQHKYTNEILKRFYMSNCKGRDTPAFSEHDITADLDED
jgi:hypothetical protein